ncbi:MAG: hypothetical protein WCL14_04435 [Bacteroidota bacterium]
MATEKGKKLLEKQASDFLHYLKHGKLFRKEMGDWMVDAKEILQKGLDMMKNQNEFTPKEYYHAMTIAANKAYVKKYFKTLWSGGTNAIIDMLNIVYGDGVEGGERPVMDDENKEFLERIIQINALMNLEEEIEFELKREKKEADPNYVSEEQRNKQRYDEFTKEAKTYTDQELSDSLKGHARGFGSYGNTRMCLINAYADELKRRKAEAEQE